jgi:FAD dependent oxidoreductase
LQFQSFPPIFKTIQRFKKSLILIYKTDGKTLMKKLALSLFGLFLFTQCAHQEQYDIVIYGGTSAGAAAAVQAARMDKSVIIIEPGEHLGGLTSGGLGKTDSGDKSVIGGISREFYQRLKQYYDNPETWKQENSSDYEGYSSSNDAIWGFEPHAAEKIYFQMLEEENIPVVKNERLDRKTGTTVENGKIISIRMESGLLVTGKMFIDATYEGDLMAGAGVSYTIGRESNQTYGETLNGVQKKQAIYHQFMDKVDPYIIPGDPSSGLLPGVHDKNPGEDGQADNLLQAYCFRLCLTDVENNRVPYPKPEGYDESRYELLLRNFEAGESGMPWLPGMMPNRKTDTNNRTGFSTDNIGMNYSFPDADYQARAEIIKEHEIYQKGLMWTLANNPRVPDKIRTEIARWGLAKDEFTDNGNWPHQLYIREARRMLGEYVVTENDCRRLVIAEDPVGLGSYSMDSHNCQRYVTPEGFVQNEGDVEVSPGGAYLISYRSMVPQKEEIRNLLVPVCLSASHIAYGSIRMEPVFMILGQSAATAAAAAIDKNLAVQDVNYPELKDRLLADKQVLDLPSD